MAPPTNPFWYQVLHPWHWLTYSQNAAAVQAVGALLGFILLWRYTVYIRRMMELAELTRRASLTPIFTAKKIEPIFNGGDLVRVAVTVRNIGQGPAAMLGRGTIKPPPNSRFAVRRFWSNLRAR
jgi:hypothetical protein